MKKDQFYGKHQHLGINKGEMERKWRTYLYEQQMQEALRMASSSNANSGGGGPAFSVGVGGSVVAGALVTIGWPEGFTYINQQGRAVEADSSIFATAVTDSKGNANFGVFDQRWVVTDWSSGSPVKKYAPISTYGGLSDGIGGKYNPAPMLSNVSVRYVNPLTTILTGTDALVGQQDFSKYEDWDFATQIIEELTDLTLTSGEIEKVKKGESVPRVYEPIITPLKKVSFLLSVMDQDDEDIDLSDLGITVKRSTLLADVIISAANVNSYVENRKKDAIPPSTLRDLSVNGEVCPLCFATTILPKWKINNADFVTDTIEALFDKNADFTTFEDIYTTYEADLISETPVDPKPISSLVEITAANTADGVISFYIVEDTASTASATLSGRVIMRPKDPNQKPQIIEIYKSNGTLVSNGSEVISTRTVNKYTFTPEVWPLSPDTAFDQLPVFTLAVETVNNRTQLSQGIQYIIDVAGSVFVSTKDGKALPGITITPDPQIPTLEAVNIKSGEKIVLDNAAPGQINKKDYWVGQNADMIDVYVYYNGIQWVLDNDPKLFGYWAYGPSDSPAGAYTSQDGKTVEWYIGIPAKK
jgi:hypothetical protein